MNGVYSSEQKFSGIMCLRTIRGKGRKEKRQSVHPGCFDNKQQFLVRNSQRSPLGRVVYAIWFQHEVSETVMTSYWTGLLPGD